MRAPRVFVHGIETGKVPQRIALPKAEARHLLLVLRRKVGDRIVVLSEAGAYEAEIASLERGPSGAEAEALLLGPSFDLPSLVPWTVAAAPARGERFELAIEMASETGLACFVPVATERSVLRVKAGSRRLSRWRRIAIESAKQCGRAPPLEIRDPVPFEEFLQRWREIAAESRPQGAPPAEPAGWILQPGTSDPADLVGLLGTWGSPGRTAGLRNALFLIGPEGGFSPGEVSLAERSGFARLALPFPVLRTPTAVLCVAVLGALSRAGMSRVGGG